MNFFDFIEHIDWNKNIIFLILYICIVVLCVFVYLFPLMDHYKASVVEYRKTEILDTQINSALSHLQRTKSELLRENAATFARLDKKFDLSQVQKYADSYLTGAKIKDLGVRDSENGIKIRTLEISGESRNLGHIKNFVTNIEALENSVRVAFPIIISKDSPRGALKVRLSIMIYNRAESAITDAAILDSKILDFTKATDSTPNTQDSIK